MAHFYAEATEFIGDQFKGIWESQIDSVLGQFIGKKKGFQGDEYLDQVEKNAHYNSLLYYLSNKTVANYLSTGIPVLKQGSEVDHFVGTHRNFAVAAAPFQLAYSTVGCEGCDFHTFHFIVKITKENKTKLSRVEYLEYIEMLYIYTRNLVEYSTKCENLLLNNRQFASKFSNYPFAQIYDAVLAAVDGQVNLITGITQALVRKNGILTQKEADMVQNGTLVLKEPSWREVWGEKYDQLYRTT